MTAEHFGKQALLGILVLAERLIDRMDRLGQAEQRVMRLSSASGPSLLRGSI